MPPGAQEPVIRQVSFHLDARRRTLGIVGPSGAGKTTLVRLVVGTLHAHGGPRAARRRGGHDMAGRGPRASRRLCLPQTRGAVRGNGAREHRAAGALPKNDDVISAAKLAGAHDVILGLPQGYDTPIGDGRRSDLGRPAPAHRACAGGLRTIRRFSSWTSRTRISMRKASRRSSKMNEVRRHVVAEIQPFSRFLACASSDTPGRLGASFQVVPVLGVAAVVDDHHGVGMAPCPLDYADHDFARVVGGYDEMNGGHRDS